MAADPFEDVLDLEDQFYRDGYRQGMEDGVQAGKIEGRSLGLEKGFEKFMESGRLYGKAIVWANRLPDKQPGSSAQGQYHGGSQEGIVSNESEPQHLPRLPGNSRLWKNITTLHALVEPESLSTENTDESVNDFDERVKRARGKAKIIERTLGEDNQEDGTATAGTDAGGQEDLKSSGRPPATGSSW